MDAHALSAVLALMIPIVSIIMGIGIGMFALYVDYRRKSEALKLYHAERMAAIEKGIDLPPLPPELFRRSGSGEPHSSRHRRSGLILLFLGLAISAAIWATTGHPGVALWGLVPASIGLAILFSSALETREKNKSASERVPPSAS